MPTGNSKDLLASAYEVCPKSKCTDFPMHDLGTQHLADRYIGDLVMALAACTYLFKLDRLSLS
jgi:hypothetical protein